ncbi:hypothetical protein [Acidimangrovimonas pyrenivorans]|uniref:Uncharacterized protein n=1 Tax=Acidimangrovimonas pyrenivorans TaxID=2030798 RepID=A0ABV7AHL0_9RHOB
MKTDLPRIAPGNGDGAAAPAIGGTVLDPLPAEADHAPPAAPLAMPRQRLEPVRGTLRLRLPGPGRRMQGQP